MGMLYSTNGCPYCHDIYSSEYVLLLLSSDCFLSISMDVLQKFTVDIRQGPIYVFLVLHLLLYLNDVALD